MDDDYRKYCKYKLKYLELKRQQGRNKLYDYEINNQEGGNDQENFSELFGNLTSEESDSEGGASGGILGKILKGTVQKSLMGKIIFLNSDWLQGKWNNIFTFDGAGVIENCASLQKKASEVIVNVNEKILMDVIANKAYKYVVKYSEVVVVKKPVSVMGVLKSQVKN